MFKSYKFLLKIVITILIVSHISVYAQNTVYIPDNNQMIKTLMPCANRYVESLTGDWEKSKDEKKWYKVYLPNSEQQDGSIIYRKDLNIQVPNVEKFVWQLYFYGIDDEVEIYINNKFIGRFLGAMTPFTVKIPPRIITSQSNSIKLVVSSASHSASQIKEQNVFAKKIYTGIIRDIILLGTPQIWVSDLNYRTKFNENLSACNLEADINISSAEIEKAISDAANKDSLAASTNKVSVAVETFLRNKQNGTIVAQSNSQQVEIERERTINVNTNLYIQNPSLWSIVNPALYELEVKISHNGQLIDQYSINMGFKDISIRQKDNKFVFYLNGVPIEIKGIDYIEDFINGGQTLSTAQMEQDIFLIKTLGANAVRFKYSFPHPYFAYLCDKYGIFMLLDLPIYEIPNQILVSDEIVVRMKNIADRIITYYSKNISTLAWGLSEGIMEGSPKVKEFEKNLNDLFHSRSDELTYKIVRINSKTVNLDGYDFICLGDDHKSNNINEIRNKIIQFTSIVTNKPLVLSFGIPIQPDNNNGYSDPFSVESQAFYIQSIYLITKELQLAGNIVWSFNDYELNLPLLITNNSNQYLCASGLLDRNRQQRKSYYTLQSLFNNEKNPLLNAGSFSENTPISYIIIGIVLSLVLIFLFNRYRRFREYLLRALMRPHNFYSDIRDQRIMSTVQSIILGIVISASLAIFFSSLLYFFRTSCLAQYALMLLIPFSFLQEFLFKITWMPEISTAFFAVSFFIVIFVVSSILMLISFFVGPKIFFSDTLIITIWSGTPFLILLPIGMILIRVLIFSPAIIWIVLPAFVLISIWVILRVLRASAVVFDIREMRVYIFGISALLLCLIFVIIFYQYKTSLISYTQYFLMQL